MTRIDPGLKGAVLRNTSTVHMTPTGPEAQVNITMPPELYEQYKQGWRCPSCHTVQDEQRPKVCKTVWKDTGERCGFPILERLGDWLAVNDRGEDELWPDFTDQDADEDERAAFTKRTGIWVPGKE